jgi:ferredoxin
MTIEATVDADLCIGAGNCVHLAPGAFELDEYGVALPLADSDAGEERIRLAARSCPTGAIAVHESHESTTP